MATPTQTIEGLVLRRTKLGESDVIVTILAQDGSQYKAVAKGARKPTSSFASRLEVFAVATILLAQGKNLDIVKEVRLLVANENLRCDLARSLAASPVVELLAKATFEEQPNTQLFDLATKVLATIASCKSDPLIITLAGLLKTLAFLGFKPIFQECVECGSSIDLSQRKDQPFSYFDGGSVCANCRAHHETTLLDASMLQWCNTLLYSTLDQITTFQIPEHTIFDALRFIEEWIRVHLGITLRSLTFLFKNTLLYP
jgi:DNA repair protein RecO (recombination protein O)